MSIGWSLRFQILERDGFKCQYCGAGIEGQLGVDHIIPTCFGGSSDPTNCITACRKCNTGKRDTVFEQAQLQYFQSIAAKPLPESNPPKESGWRARAKAAKDALKPKDPFTHIPYEMQTIYEMIGF